MSVAGEILRQIDESTDTDGDPVLLNAGDVKHLIEDLEAALAQKSEVERMYRRAADKLDSLAKLFRCEGCGKHVLPDPETPDGRGHVVASYDGVDVVPELCGQVSAINETLAIQTVDRLRNEAYAQRNRAEERLKEMRAERDALEARAEKAEKQLQEYLVYQERNCVEPIHGRDEDEDR